MTDDLEHHGIPGMHWGHRKAKDTPQEKSKKTVSFGDLTMKASEAIAKHVNGRTIVAGMLATYGALLVGTMASAAFSDLKGHFSDHPIKVYVDYTKPPFKWKKPPFYKVTIGKSIQRKLLTG